jgi:tetratricopeptide (TPR) repeat protein
METLARLLSGGMTYEELLEKVVPHLLERCPVCQEIHREILRMQAVVGHWNEEVVVTEWLEAPELWAQVSDLPYEEQVKKVESETRFQTWGFCQLLLRKSLDSAFEDPGSAVNFANLAVSVSRRLGDVYHPEWIQDLRARSLAYLGNARRVLGELRSADDAFRLSESHLEQGTGDPRKQAEILDLKSSLRRAQRRLDEALTLSETALSLYRVSGDIQGVGVSLLKKTNLLTEMGKVNRAISTLQRNMPEIEGAQDPRLVAYARFNLLGCLTLAKRYEEAARLQSQVRQMLATFDEPVNLLRLRWTEANIALGLGRIDEAESAFHEVQAAFLERGMAYDAALVSLDLAVVYLRERKLSELKQLASGLVLLFESRDVHREALGALYLFQKACEEEQLTEQAVNQLVEVLRRRQTAREA